MTLITTIIIGLIAFLHLYIMWFEMFKWTSRGPKIFTTLPNELFEPTKEMAANQGLYNGFLAAGLVWSLFIKDTVWQQNIALCFLIFVAIAGIYGAFTVSKKIVFVQTLPAVIAILLLYLL